MSAPNRRTGVLAALAAILLGLALWLWMGPAAPGPTTSGLGALDAGSPAAEEAPTRLSKLRLAPRPVDGGLPDAPAPDPDDARTFARFGWGSGESDLGRERPQEANPEAPMSLTTDLQGNVWVLDQVNQRLVKLDKTGKRVATSPLTVQAGQDLVIADDGTVAVIDRLVDRTVALMGPDGQLKGELPLQGKGIEETGGITGVFTQGEDVYAEREHGDLVKLGTTSGQADDERPEVPGRPSRDGSFYMTAAIADGPAGAVMVTAVEKSKAHRFTRQYTVGTPVLTLNLLDSDATGIIYLGVVGETPQSTAEKPQLGVQVLCLDPLDGRPLGRVTLPPNTEPDETFRELAVTDDGVILYLHRTEEGSRILRVTCGG